MFFSTDFFFFCMKEKKLYLYYILDKEKMQNKRKRSPFERTTCEDI